MYPIAANGMKLRGYSNKHHSLIKLQVGTDCWLKLLFFGIHPIVVHGQEHGQLKKLNRCSMPPSKLKRM